MIAGAVLFFWQILHFIRFAKSHFYVKHKNGLSTAERMERKKGFGDAPQQADIFKNPDQGFYENMVSVSTLTLLAILRIVGSEAGRQPLN